MVKIICQKIQDVLYTAVIHWLGGSACWQVLRSLDHSSGCFPFPALHHFLSVGIVYCRAVAVFFQMQ